MGILERFLRLLSGCLQLAHHPQAALRMEAAGDVIRLLRGLQVVLLINLCKLPRVDRALRLQQLIPVLKIDVPLRLLIGLRVRRERVP